MRDQNTAQEMAYSDALTCVAQGETREDTRTYLLENFPDVEGPTLAAIMDDAYADAIRQGVEKEDTDESWRN